MGAIAEVTRGLPTRQTSEGPRGAGSSGDPVLVSRVSDSEVRRPSPLSLCAKRSSGGAPGWAFWWELAGQRRSADAWLGSRRVAATGVHLWPDASPRRPEASRTSVVRAEG
jgi:hypothetical protein